MSTIVKTMANLYFDFYSGDVFNTGAAKKILGEHKDVERRVKYINAIYDTILGSSIINETSKIFIKSRKSYAEVARYYNTLHNEQDENCLVHAKTEALVKSDICYTNKKLKSVLACDISKCSQKNFFKIVMWDKMDATVWTKADEALDKLKSMCNGSLLSKNKFWLNVPVHEFEKELPEEEFMNLVELIKPYFTTQKALTQMKINEMKKEAGYLNYILTADMELTEIDKARREYILSLMDRNLLKEYKDDLSQETSGKSQSLIKLQKKLLQLSEESSLEKKRRIELMSKVGLLYYTNQNRIFTDLQKKQIECIINEYERLKKVEMKRQQDMKGLQAMIDKLREQQNAIRDLGSDDNNSI